MNLKQNKDVKEDGLYDTWELFCRYKCISKNRRLRGLYSGRLDKFDGPDFQGAEIELDKQVYRGDIEIHVKSGDWYLHGHHLDARYDHVILHLVWYLNDASDNIVRNSKGLSVPTLSMRQLQIPKSSRKFAVKNCISIDRHKEFLQESLKKMKMA